MTGAPFDPTAELVAAVGPLLAYAEYRLDLESFRLGDVEAGQRVFAHLPAMMREVGESLGELRDTFAEVGRAISAAMFRETPRNIGS